MCRYNIFKELAKLILSRKTYFRGNMDGEITLPLSPSSEKAYIGEGNKHHVEKPLCHVWGILGGKERMGNMRK